MKFPYVMSEKIREAVSYVTHRAWIHRIEVMFITSPVMKTKVMFQTQNTVQSPDECV